MRSQGSRSTLSLATLFTTSNSVWVTRRSSSPKACFSKIGRISFALSRRHLRRINSRTSLEQGGERVCQSSLQLLLVLKVSELRKVTAPELQEPFHLVVNIRPIRCGGGFLPGQQL